MQKEHSISVMQGFRITVDGVALQIQDNQRSAGAIIFLHFGGANLMMWRGVVPRFQNEYRLILMDLRGHGKSDKPLIGYHIDDMAGDVAGVMEHLGLEQAHIVGSSMGAEVGLSLAANYPTMVASLVCDGAHHSEFGPHGTWDGSAAEFREHVAGQLEKVESAVEPVFASIEELVNQTRETLEKRGWWNANFEALARYDACEIGEEKFTNGWRKWAKVGYMQHYFECRFEDYYPRVRCPVLMLAGKYELRDERLMVVMNQLCALSPNAKLVGRPDWIHPYGWLLAPGLMCEVVLEFLTQLRD